MVKTILTLEQMKKLPTKRLLAYKKKLWETGFDMEWFPCSCPSCEETAKRVKEQQELIAKVKSVLMTREHISKIGTASTSLKKR